MEAASAAAPWLDLPEDLTELILERLPIADYISFAAVCPKWRSIQRRCRRSPLPIPWICPYPLIRYEADHMICLCPFDAPDNINAKPPRKCRSFLLPTAAADDFDKFPLASSTHGWLIMFTFSETEPQTLDLFNPVSGTHVPLPPLPKGPNPYTACMSCSPTHPDCTVIIPCVDCVFLWRAREPDWTTLPCPNTLTDFRPWARTSIFHDGKFYFLGSEGRLNLNLFVIDPFLNTPAVSGSDVVVRLVDMGWSHTPFTDKLWFSKWRTDRLVECNGDLLMVVALVPKRSVDNPLQELQGVLVFRADYSRKMWVRVESIGDRALFISNACSFSLPAADVGVTENCIYFSDLFKPLVAPATLWTAFDLGAGRVIHEPLYPDSYSEQYRSMLLAGNYFWIIPRLASATPTSD